MLALNELKELAPNYSVMCVDDNESLKTHLETFLNKFFDKVISADNGDAGVKLFMQEQPDIVLTDIEMPVLDGLSMTKQIKSINKDVPVIIMSAYDEKRYLLDSIHYGVVDYLIKPAKSKELAEILLSVLHDIKFKEDKEAFVTYLQHIFDYQNNMILLIQNGEPVTANPLFLSFFSVNSITEYKKTISDIGELFVEQRGFLYSSEEMHWLEKVAEEPGKHFHVKMIDPKSPETFLHFLLQYQTIPERQGYGLLLMDDITDLNLLGIFDVGDVDDNDIYPNRESIKGALELVYQHHLNVKIHNYYKGLSITNPAKILEITDKTIVLQTNAHQLRASDFEKSVVISSDALPHFIIGRKIIALDYATNVIVVSELYFMKNGPTQRKNIRITPCIEHTISFECESVVFDDCMSISDISVDAVKIKMASKPLAIDKNCTISLDIALNTKDKKPLKFRTPAHLIRTHEHDTYVHMVFGYELQSDQKKILVEYIAKRQMELVREFKRNA